MPFPSTIDFHKYENELATVTKLFSASAYRRQDRDKTFCSWLRMMSNAGLGRAPLEIGISTVDIVDQGDRDTMIQDSYQLRREGNILFDTTDTDGAPNLIGACRKYTHAIFAAPSDCQALALAYANRGAVLIKFGYYGLAYDNCLIALELPYPTELRHKVLLRQAECTIKLGKCRARFRRILGELDRLTLDEDTKKAVEELRKVNDEILSQTRTVQCKPEGPQAEVPPDNNKTKVVKSTGLAGRYLVTKETIWPHEVAFGDHAFPYMSSNRLVPSCQHCAATLIIPIPCKQCFNRVVYCSRKCRNDHANLHRYECVGYQRNIFPNVGVGQLALRGLLIGFRELFYVLRHKTTAQEMWLTIFGDDVETNDAEPKFMVQHLGMVHHLEHEKPDKIYSLSSTADMLVLYLRRFTDFFRQLEPTPAPTAEWELFLAAILLRLIAQYSVNDYEMPSLVPVFRQQTPVYFSINGRDPVSITPAPQEKFSLLRQDLWASPWHLKKGKLHNFKETKTVTTGIFPYANTCNHSCERLFHHRFSGRYLTVYPLDKVGAGTTITRCYTEDYRQAKRQQRREELQQKHYFECECVRCVKAKPDEELKSFHRYRCDNSDCAQIFVPHLPHRKSLNWWSESGSEPPLDGKQISCTICGKKQEFNWVNFIDSLLMGAINPNTRRSLYRVVHSLSEWLIDMNELRMDLSMRVVSQCLLHYSDGVSLEDNEFVHLLRLLKYALSGYASLYGEFSLQYVGKLTLLWDFIAMGKYECSHAEMQRMHQIVNKTVSEEFRVVFKNYYKDYMRQQLLPRASSEIYI